MFDESDIHDTPTGAGSKESQTFFARLKRIGGSKSVKYQPVELSAQRSECDVSNFHSHYSYFQSTFKWKTMENVFVNFYFGVLISKTSTRVLILKYVNMIRKITLLDCKQLRKKKHV